MFIGHGMLAFALVALAGRRFGWSADHTLSLALLAGGFATLPDVDMVYAPVGLLGGVSGVFAASEAFWQTGNVVHRVITHSLVVGVVAAVGFGCWTAARDWQTHAVTAGWGRRDLAVAGTALAMLGGLVAAAVVVTGGLAGVIMAVFVLGGLVMTTVAARRGIGPVSLTVVALVGLLSHPFGDMVTGSPPALLYPFEATLVAERVVLHPDPTLHLVGAFVLELSTFWLALWAYCRCRDRPVRSLVTPRAALGVGYAGAVFVVPAPTLDVSAPFVFSILAVGVVGSAGLRAGWTRSTPGRTGDEPARASWTLVPRSRPVVLADTQTALVTGLSAVTLAVAGYTLAYLLVV